MKVFLFLVTFLILILSFYVMSLAFVFPEYGAWIFMGGILLSVLSYAIPTKLLRK